MPIEPCFDEHCLLDLFSSGQLNVQHRTASSSAIFFIILNRLYQSCSCSEVEEHFVYLYKLTK